MTVTGSARAAMAWHGMFSVSAALRALAVAALVQCAPALALVGTPPMTMFAPNVGAPPASTDVAQDATSLMYVANGGGVLTFDGEIWQLIRLPNGDSSTSLSFDGTSRVYVGAHNLVGYLESDATGKPIFHDLTPLYAEQLRGEAFGDIYQIMVAPQGVFFSGSRHVFLYVPGAETGRVWRNEGHLGAITLVDGTPILQFRGEGLRRFVGGEWVRIPGTSGLSDLANELLRLPGGGLLAMSWDSTWRIFVDGQVHDFQMPAGFPPPSAFNAAGILKDGSFAFAGIDGTLWVYDPRTGRSQSMHVAEGPLNEVRVANDGGLLAVSDLAVYHIEWPGEWTTLGLRNGVSGTVHRLRQWDDRWLVLSSNGAYTGSASSDRAAAFQRLDYTDNDSWDLMPLGPHVALLAETYQLYLADEKRVIRPLGRKDLYPRILMRSTSHPDQIYVGTEFGLAILDTQGGDYKFRIQRQESEELVTSIVELSPTQLLIGTSRNGIRRITLDANRTRILEDRELGDADGVHYGQKQRAALSTLEDRLITASTGAGLFRWTGEHFVAAQLAGLELGPMPQPVVSFAAGPTEAWAYGDDRIFRRDAAGVWHAVEIGNILSGYVQSLAFDGQGVALFGCANAILRFEAVPGLGPRPVDTVQLRTVEEIGPTTEGQRYALVPATPMRVKDDFSIGFHFALPEFHGQHVALYQARLRGRDESFSNWQVSNQYRYRHLPAGEYTFQVAARDALGRISETRPFEFVVLPPWYLTVWAKALWIALGIAAVSALIYGVIVWRTRSLTHKKAELELMVTDRTRELVAANARLHDLAHRDILTGLANRALFERRLEQARASAQRHNRRFAVLFIDLDQFKTINDSLGHEAGDRLLKEVSARLTTQLRSEDTLARWGGDEFMVLAEDLHSAEDVAVIAESLLEAASAPINLSEGNLVALSTSVGVSLYPDDSTNVNELIRNADTAMYSAKKRGGNQLCFYASEMTAQARERLEIRNGLRTAVENDEFILHYQPIVQLSTGRIVGAEALIRWQRGPTDLVWPATFIPVAESSDLISLIGAWVLRTACHEAREWLARDPEFTLAINISPRQLRSIELVRMVADVMEETGVEPHQLTLEVTESSIADGGEDARKIIDALKGLGVRIAVDDFGTGQSSLASLKRFEFDALKVDRSFIADIPRDGDQEIASTIVAMAHNLRLEVTAEGVETEEQLAFLQSCHCDRYQGFLFSPGVTASVLSDILHAQNAVVALTG